MASTSTTRPPARRGGDRGVERMDEQVGTEATPVDRRVERELGQQDRGDLAESATGQARRRVLSHQEVGRQSDVADDRAFAVDQDGGAGSLPGGRAGVTAQPVVQLGVAAGELREVVVAEALDPVGHRAAMRGTRRDRFAAFASRGAWSGSSSAANRPSK